MDYEQIKKLMDDMGDSKISEIEIVFPEGMKISMKKNTQVDNVPIIKTEKENEMKPPTTQINVNSEAKIEQSSKNKKDDKIITSPMVGTFYSSPSPKENSFVKIGDTVKLGQVVCIIEAMKLMNEIESEYEGKVEDVLVKDGDIVEYGTPLFKIV